MVLPSYVKEVVQRLDEAGYVAYVVGGSVRDHLLGRDTKDHDIATSADPDEVCRIFPNAITVGKQFGVIKVPVNVNEKDAPVLLEIATFREDLEYHNHRHPQRVKFSSPLEDAKRRDFTINAIFYDPKTSRLLDSTDGFSDLKAKIIRAIGDPKERFREDALRLLRAVRFAARFGFAIEPQTMESIALRAKLITQVSAERIRDELTLMWQGPRPAKALELLSSLGLLEHVLPEVEALRAAAPNSLPWRLALKGLQVLHDHVPQRSAELSWATLLSSLARLQGPGEAPAALDGPASVAIAALASRLKMSTAQADAIVGMTTGHSRFREVFKMRESTLHRFVREPRFEELLALHRIDATLTDGNLAFYEFARSRFDELKKGSLPVPKLIDGTDLIQLGLTPGPGYSEILRVIEDLAIEQRLRTKEDALEYVVKNFVK